MAFDGGGIVRIMRPRHAPAQPKGGPHAHDDRERPRLRLRGEGLRSSHRLPPRPHLRSPQVGREGHSLEDEAENLHALMAQWGASPAHVVGLSMGGMVALRLALAHPQDVRSLTSLDASAEEELPERRPLYEQLAATAKAQGPQTVADPVVGFMFSRDFVRSEPEKVEAYKSSFGALDMGGLGRATKAVTRRCRGLA